MPCPSELASPTTKGAGPAWPGPPSLLRSARPWPARIAAGALALALAVAAPPARTQQSDLPFVPDAWKFGRRTDEGRLRLCVDTRDAAWQVDREIGEALASALLLEPTVHEVRSGLAVQSLEDLYGLMLENCAVHLGFRLLPGAYPDWATLTRPYYEASYVFVTAEPGWNSLADIPRSEAVATMVGTRADLRFTSYILGLREGRRWQRFPTGQNELALQAVRDGTAAAALVWEPALWALQQDDESYADLRAIAADPLPETFEGVGGVVLSRETYLRNGLDEAIRALSVDGTIARILERHDFPAEVAR
jgi:polar amino acid transport system substrate-binding protein